MRKKTSQDERIIEKNITQRCGGYSYRVRMTVCGVRIDENFDSLHDARAFRDRKRADLALDPTMKLVLQSKSAKRAISQMTLAVLLNRYLREVTPLKKDKRAETHRINKLLRFPIAALSIQMIDRFSLASFLSTGKTEGWSSSTARKYLMLISAVFTAASKKWGLALTNPIGTIEIPSNGTARSRRLLPGEYDAMLESLKRCRNKYVSTLFIVAVETAARRGELLKLQWKDVDLVTGTALFKDTKNSEDRKIPLSSLARSILKDLPRSDCDQVFPIKEYQARSAFEMAQHRARKHYEKRCALSGVTPDSQFLVDLRFHDLRREGTTRLFERGFDLMEAAAVTGHKTLGMLKRYTNLRAEDLAKKLI